MRIDAACFVGSPVLKNRKMVLRIDAAWVLIRSVLEDRDINHVRGQRARLDDDEVSCLGMRVEWFSVLVCSFSWESFGKQGLSLEREDRECGSRI